MYESPRDPPCLIVRSITRAPASSETPRSSAGAVDQGADAVPRGRQIVVAGDGLAALQVHHGDTSLAKELERLRSRLEHEVLPAGKHDRLQIMLQELEEISGLNAW